MTRSLQWRFLLILAVLIGAAIFLYPTFVKELPSWWPKFFPQDKIHLGLDLQGGMHLTFEVETDKAVESYLERVKNNLRDDLKDAKIPVGKLDREKNARARLHRGGQVGTRGC